LFQLIMNYPSLSLQEINDRIENIVDSMEHIVDIKVKESKKTLTSGEPGNLE